MNWTDIKLWLTEVDISVLMHGFEKLIIWTEKDTITK